MSTSKSKKLTKALSEIPGKIAKIPGQLAEFPERLAEIPDQLASLPEKMADLSLDLPDQIRASIALARKLRKPSGYRFAIADGVAFLNPVAWDHCAGQGSFFLSRAYLAMLEAVAPDNVEPRYALIYRDEEPIAAVYMQIVSITGDRIIRKKAVEQKALPAKNPLAQLQRLLAPASQSVSQVLRERVLVCGNLFTFGQHAFAVAPGVRMDDIWAPLAEVLYRVRRQERLSGQTDFTMIKDITSQEQSGIRVLSHLDYVAAETEPNMLLDLRPEWKTYDDYLGSLASKYRSAVKQSVYKPLDEAGCVVETITDPADYAERIHELYLAVHEKAALRMVTVPQAYFAGMAAVAGERFRCTVIRQGERILSFITTVKDGDTVIAYHIGFDRAAAEALPLYLRMLHAAIADGIALGGKRISFGRTALEPKAGLGCKPEPMYSWLKQRSPVLTMVIRNLLAVAPVAEPPERNPFKKSAG